MNDTLSHQEYISYTLHHPGQQSMGGYVTLNGGQLDGQQPYGVMHHSDLLQQAASGLLATEAPDGPLMMGATVGSTGGVLLTLNGANGAIHNGSTALTNVIHQQQHQQTQGQQYATLNSSTGSPLGTVLVNNNIDSPKGGTQQRCAGPNTGQQVNNQQQQQMSNGNGNVHHSKKKRKPI